MSNENIVQFDRLPVLTDCETVEFVQRVGFDLTKWTRSFLPQSFLDKIGENFYESWLSYHPEAEKEARQYQIEVILEHSEPMYMMRTKWGLITANYHEFEALDITEQRYLEGLPLGLEAEVDEEDDDDDDMERQNINCRRYFLTFYSDRFSVEADTFPFRDAIIDYLGKIVDESHEIDVYNGEEAAVVAQMGVDCEIGKDSTEDVKNLTDFFVKLMTDYKFGKVMINGFETDINMIPNKVTDAYSLAI